MSNNFCTKVRVRRNRENNSEVSMLILSFWSPLVLFWLEDFQTGLLI